MYISSNELEIITWALGSSWFLELLKE
jgi:hypothetical protein